MNTSSLRDCLIRRTEPRILEVGACQFGFPNIQRRSLAPVTIRSVSGSGAVYVFARPSGSMRYLIRKP
jgi:hypothetical protein